MAMKFREVASKEDLVVVRYFSHVTFSSDFSPGGVVSF